jgi:hypothetical protein
LRPLAIVQPVHTPILEWSSMKGQVENAF